MHDFFVSKKIAFEAIGVWCVLTGMYVFVTRTLDIDVSFAFHVSISISIVLLSLLVYQSLRASMNARFLAQSMVKDALLYSHELFTEVYQAGPVPYVLVDVNGTVESLNRAAMRLFKTSEEVCKGTNIFDAVESENTVRIGLCREYLKQGIAVNDEEVRVMQVGGTHRWVMLSIFSFTDSARTQKGLMTFVDITKQKQVDAAKTEFVSLASHQLRTPLTTMKWNMELLHSTNPNAFTGEQQELYGRVMQGLVRMDLLVTDFLNASRFELGTLTVDRTQFDLTTFVYELMQDHRAHAEERQIQIEEVWGERPYLIYSDLKLLTMILGNLLSNAVKYTRDGGHVRLEVMREAEWVIFKVIDTGIGIPPDEHEQIFSKIFRASNARAQVAEGTGLGLYIVREAVTVLGGTISFVSQIGVGTTFTVALPNEPFTRML